MTLLFGIEGEGDRPALIAADTGRWAHNYGTMDRVERSKVRSWVDAKGRRWVAAFSGSSMVASASEQAASNLVMGEGETSDHYVQRFLELLDANLAQRRERRVALGDKEEDDCYSGLIATGQKLWGISAGGTMHRDVAMGMGYSGSEAHCAYNALVLAGAMPPSEDWNGALRAWRVMMAMRATALRATFCVPPFDWMTTDGERGMWE